MRTKHSLSMRQISAIIELQTGVNCKELRARYEGRGKIGRARETFCQRASLMGHSSEQIARFIKRDASTVRYHIRKMGLGE